MVVGGGDSGVAAPSPFEPFVFSCPDCGRWDKIRLAHGYLSWFKRPYHDLRRLLGMTKLLTVDVEQGGGGRNDLVVGE